MPNDSSRSTMRKQILGECPGYFMPMLVRKPPSLLALPPMRGALLSRFQVCLTVQKAKVFQSHSPITFPSWKPEEELVELRQLRNPLQDESGTYPHVFEGATVLPEPIFRT